MKKYFGFIAAIIVITTLLVTDSYAQPSGKGKMSGNRGSRFVDTNGDGVCDNFATKSLTGKGVNFVDTNGDGICDNNTTGKAGAGMGNHGKTRPNFIDVNGDGVCDNNTTGKVGAGIGNHGKTRPNFIDADGDGVCDHFINATPIVPKNK